MATLGFGLPLGLDNLENLVAQRRLQRIQDTQLQEQLRAKRANEALAQQELGMRGRQLDIQQQRYGAEDALHRDTMAQQLQVAKMLEEGRNTREAQGQDFTAAQNQLYKRDPEAMQTEITRHNMEMERLQAQNRQERAPYYTFMPNYDAQGRPVGILSGNARTGQVQPVGGEFVNKPPPGNLGQQTIGNEAAMDQLDRLRQQFKPEYVGPFEGRARSLGQKIPGVPVNEGFANFEAATAAFRNSVIKAITGAQMSEPEANRIRQQIPEVTDKPEVWLAKAAQTARNLQDLERRVKTDRPLEPATPQGGGGGLPKIGDIYQGGKVLSIERVQ